MPRPLALALVSLALIAIAAALYLRATSAPVVAPPIDTPDASVATTANTPPTPAELERSVAPATLTQPRSDDCHLFGLVVDGTGAPLVDARVWFFALDGRWASGVTPPEIRVRGGPVGAYETRSRADGRFELRTPPPSGLRLRLEVESADHRGHISRDLRASAEASAKSIAAGENDFGKLVVPLRSAITGLVLSRSGTPLAGANVGAHATDGSTFDASCATELDGSFALASLPAGEYTLSAAAPRHEAGSLELKLAPNRLLTDIALVLDPTPLLSGRVLNTDGDPVAGVAVYAAPEGRSDEHDQVSTQSSNDGRFAVKLRKSVPHAIWTNSQTLETWDSRLAGLPDFSPGRQDIEIRLAKLATTRVHVVDALTRAPLAVCSVTTLDEISRRSGTTVAELELREICAGDLPSGRAQPPAGVSVPLTTPPPRVVLSAPGYKPVVETLVAHAEQTFALAQLGAVRGKLTIQDRKRIDDAVMLVPADADMSDAAARGVRDPLSECGRSGGYPALTPSVRREIFAPDWSFTIQDVHAGTYAVFALLEGPRHVIEDTQGRRWESPLGLQAHCLRKNVVVRVGETLDLGTFELAPERAAARIDVLTRPDADRTLLRMLLTATVNGATVPIDFPITERPWSLDALPLGTLAVRFADVQPLLGMRSWSLQLATGADNVLTVDLRDLELCAIRLADAPFSLDTSTVQVRMADGSAELTLDFGAFVSGGVFLAPQGARVIVETHRAAIRSESNGRVVEDRGPGFRVLGSSGVIELPHAPTFELVLPR